MKKLAIAALVAALAVGVGGAVAPAAQASSWGCPPATC